MAGARADPIVRRENRLDRFLDDSSGCELRKMGSCGSAHDQSVVSFGNDRRVVVFSRTPSIRSPWVCGHKSFPGGLSF